MRLTREQAAEIKASRGLYRASDVAREYDVHPSTVARIWAGEAYKDIRPSREAPDINVITRPRDVVDDIRTLLMRGMKPVEVAKRLQISIGSVYAYGGWYLT